MSKTKKIIIQFEVTGDDKKFVLDCIANEPYKGAAAEQFVHDKIIEGDFDNKILNVKVVQR